MRLPRRRRPLSAGRIRRQRARSQPALPRPRARSSSCASDCNCAASSTSRPASARCTFTTTPACFTAKHLLDALRRAASGASRRSTTSTCPPASSICRCPGTTPPPSSPSSKYMQSVRPDAPWCPSNIEFIRRINGLDSIDDVQRIVFDAAISCSASATSISARRSRRRSIRAIGWSPRSTTRRAPGRLKTPSASAARICASTAWKDRAAISSSAAPCRCGTRTERTADFEPGKPWLLRFFDQIRFYPVSAGGTARDARRVSARDATVCASRAGVSGSATITPSSRSIERECRCSSNSRQQAAFEAERERWARRPRTRTSKRPSASHSRRHDAVPEGCRRCILP